MYVRREMYLRTTSIKSRFRINHYVYILTCILRKHLKIYWIYYDNLTAVCCVSHSTVRWESTVEVLIILLLCPLLPPPCSVTEPVPEARCDGVCLSAAGYSWPPPPAVVPPSRASTLQQHTHAWRHHTCRTCTVHAHVNVYFMLAVKEAVGLEVLPCHGADLLLLGGDVMTLPCRCRPSGPWSDLMG